MTERRMYRHKGKRSVSFCLEEFAPLSYYNGNITDSPVLMYEYGHTYKSDFCIGYYVADGCLYGNFYPDSLPLTDNNVVRKMEPGKRKILLYKPCSTWKRFFEWLPNDTLYVYIFHSDSLEYYPWDEIRDKYMILKRYDISLDDWKRMDYEIVYSK